MKHDRNEIPKHKIEEAVKNAHSMIAAAKYLNVSRDKFNKYAKNTKDIIFFIIYIRR